MFESLKFTVSAPGKVILFGEHAVVYGKKCIAATISKRTTLNFETINNEFIELEINSVNLNVSIPLNTFNNMLDHISSEPFENIVAYTSKLYDYYKTLHVSSKLVNNLENFIDIKLDHNQRLSLQCIAHLLYCFYSFKREPLKPFKITVKSDLSMGAGTGSSASYSVCLASALFHYFRIVYPIDDCFDVKNFTQFTVEDKYLINEWAFVCEQIIHGTASGVDNFVCVFGSAVEVIFNSETKTKDFKILEDIFNLRVLLVNTGVKRSTSVLVKKVAQLRNKHKNTVDLILEAIGEIANSASSVLSQLKVNELNLNGNEFRETFTQFEDLVSLNHGLLVSIDVSHETLNDIVSTAAQFGLKAKLTGAGGGGYAIIFIPPFVLEENVNNCIMLLKSKQYTVEDIIIGDTGINIIHRS